VTLDTEIGAELRDVPSPTRRRVLVRRAVRIAWFTILAVGLALALRSRWAEVRDELATLQLEAVWLSLAVALVGVGASSGIWHQMFRGLGEPLPLRVSLRIFFAGQIGKYLPGAVWPAVTQAALARDHGVAPRATVSAVTLFLWVHLITGTIVAALVLGGSGRLPVLTLLAVPVLVALLTPRLLGWSLQTLFRLARRRPLDRVPDGRHLAQACAWAAVMWVCYGIHLYLLTVAIDDPVDVVVTTGVFAAAWVVGFVLLIAPAGVGPREAAIVALLPLSAASGLTVALVSRLIMAVADGAWAAITAIDVDRVLGRSTPPRSGDAG
jgi:glycosyltransferase 2 family protein